MDRCTTPKKHTKSRPGSNARVSANYSALDERRGDVSWSRRGAVPDVEHFSSVCGRTSMSTKTTKFLTDWLRWHVVGRVASAEDIPALEAKCLHDAWREGISRFDIEDAVGSVEGCIREALLQVKK